MAWRLWASLLPLLLTTACIGRGAAARAQIPQPTNFAMWLAIAVVVIGLWWAAIKILRG